MTSTRPLLFLVAAVLVGAVPSAAAQQAHDGCDAAHDTLAMRACYSRSLTAADREMNGVYRDVSAHLDPNRRSKLRDAQRAWLRYRDAQCAFAASESEGGTLETVERLSCLADATRARTRQLREAQRSVH